MARYVVENGKLGPVVECSIPQPGDDELLLRINATSLNYHDLVGIDGSMPTTAPLPRVPCSDASATVIGVGKNVLAFAVGDKVIPGFFPDWLSGPISLKVMAPVLGDEISGTLQSHLCIAAKSVVRAPKGMGDAAAATLGCAALTAWRCLVVEGNVKPGQTVVLQGTGGASLAALRICKMFGARVIHTSSSDEKLERVRQLGADVLINYRTTPQWYEGVLAATDGIGADMVFEVGGSDTLPQSLMATKVGGHIYSVGTLTGFQASDFPLWLVMQKNITLKGVTVGSIQDLDDMCRAIEVHGYDPVIDSTYALEEAHLAIDNFRAQKHFGKVVINIR